MSNMEITDLAAVDAVPGLADGNECLNVDSDHAIITLLYNILLELKVQTTDIEQIKINTTPS